MNRNILIAAFLFSAFNLPAQVNFTTYTNSSIKNKDMVNGVTYTTYFTGEGSDRTLHIKFTASRSWDYSNVYLVYGFVLNNGSKWVNSNFMQCSLLESQEIREAFPPGRILSGYLVFYDKTINGSAGYNGYSSYDEELKYRPYVCELKKTIYNAATKAINDLKLNMEDFSGYMRSITPPQYCD